VISELFNIDARIPQSTFESETIHLVVERKHDSATISVFLVIFCLDSVLMHSLYSTLLKGLVCLRGNAASTGKALHDLRLHMSGDLCSFAG
jgi:hypothetical protein